MKGKISANCQHFTGKKKPFSSVKGTLFVNLRSHIRISMLNFQKYLNSIGLSPSGKARDFDSRIRWFESD